MCCELLFHFISFLLLFDKIPHDWSMLRPSEHFHKSHLTKCGHYPSKARDTREIASLRFDWIPFNNLCTMLLSIFYGSFEQLDHQSLAPEWPCNKKANNRPGRFIVNPFQCARSFKRRKCFSWGY